MAEDLSLLEKKIEELTAQLQNLQGKVESQAGQANATRETEAITTSTAISTAPADTTKKGYTRPDETMEVTEELLAWAGKTALLPRLATLCFLLVMALVLRTITDNKMIDPLLGSGIGMGYAAALMVAGWLLYRKENPLAPIFSATGAIIMGTIVVETHTRFQSLPLVPAYLTLMATGAWMTFTSYRHNAFVPISCGTLSMCLAGAAIDYPHPYFPYLSMILITANVLGFFAARLKRCSWLRWTVLVVTLVMLQLWAVRLSSVMAKNGTPTPDLAPDWFFPVVGLYALTFICLALAGIVKSGVDSIARFDYLLPTVSAAWIFTTTHYVISAGGGSKVVFGAFGIAAALGHLAIGFWLGGRALERAPGTNSYIAAGSFLLAYALQVTLPNPLIALPFLGGAAIGLTWLSKKWNSGGVRFSSYLLQIYAVMTAAMLLYAATPARDPAIGAVVSALLAATGLVHYRICRSLPPPSSSRAFTRYDSGDRSAALLLLGSLTSFFFMLRIGAYHLLLGLPGEIANSFRCSQTVIINCAAVALMIIAMTLRNSEIRNLAILVTIIGAVKVFLFDLMSSKGVPLVLSVLSFGIAAAVESIILGRWQSLTKITPDTAEKPST